MEDSDNRTGDNGTILGQRRLIIGLVLAVAGIIYLGCCVAPPWLMDDVDAVHGQLTRTMLTSGDWVTARLDGVKYLEKAPLMYWAIVISYKIFGVHDWAARIPIALAAVGLAWVTAAFGIWAFGRRAGLYAGLIIATCVGLFLFTRILIPDVILTLTMTLALWAFLRVLEEDEPHPRIWALVLAINLGLGLLLKSLIAVVFPGAAAAIFLLITRQFFVARTWKRLRPISGAAVILLIAVPWHVLAAMRNPPIWVWTLKSGPGLYHGFLWFYFVNEQVLRFLNLRYPRDYNTVPRAYFWLFHLVWLFPWSVYFPAIAKLSFKPEDRAGRVRLLALCFTGFLLAFFTFSTTQEYYSMPCYPALALLIGSAMAGEGIWVRRGTRALAVVRGDCGGYDSIDGAARGDARGHFERTRLSPEGVYAVARAYGRFDAGRLCVLAVSAGSRGGSVFDRGAGKPALDGVESRPGSDVDDGDFFPCGADGAGGV